jgi:maleylpyruvate isomerase
VVRPVADVEAVRAATRVLLATVDELGDDQMREPSRLPGWSRAEVVAHLARNADGAARVAQAAARGDVGKQYPGGAAQRAAEIAAARDLKASVLRSDLRRSCDALMDAWAALPDDAWALAGRTLAGERPLHAWPWSRRREVEVHHVDLAAGYTPDQWPVAFVVRALDHLVTGMPGRAVAAPRPERARYCIEATDHGRAWTVEIDGRDVVVSEGAGEAADGTVSGWGCDLTAWLLGRTSTGTTVTASGDDPRALRIPQWFPFE